MKLIQESIFHKIIDSQLTPTIPSGARGVRRARTAEDGKFSKKIFFSEKSKNTRARALAAPRGVRAGPGQRKTEKFRKKKNFRKVEKYSRMRRYVFIEINILIRIKILFSKYLALRNRIGVAKLNKYV